MQKQANDYFGNRNDALRHTWFFFLRATDRLCFIDEHTTQCDSRRTQNK
jgi:hypothetical protein